MAVAVFILVEETQAVAQKGERDFLKVAWVDLRKTARTEVLEVAVVVAAVVAQDRMMEVKDRIVEVKEKVEVEVEEDSPVEAVEVRNVILVEEGEDLTTVDKINKTNVVTIQLVMVM